MIQFKCSGCQSKFSMTDDKGGQTGRCPKCGAAIEVPFASAAGEWQAPTTKTTQASPARATVLEDARDDEDEDDGEIALAPEPELPGRASAKPTLQSNSGLVINAAQGVVTVSIHQASILDTSLIEKIAKELYVLVDQQAQRKIVLDFTQVKFLSSQMLGVIVSLHKRAAGIKGQIVLCGLRPEIRKVFTITSMDKILPIAPNESEAIQLLG